MFEIDDPGFVWYIGETMHVYFFDPETGWFWYNSFDTTDESDGSLQVFIAKLYFRARAMGCIDIDYEFSEYYY